MSKPEEFDALVKIQPGEPYFAILARDPLSVPLVLMWAEINRDNALTSLRGDKRDHELRQSTEAEEVAWRMDEWQRGVKPVKPASKENNSHLYSGHELPEEAKNQKRLFVAHMRAVEALSECRAELSEALSDLEEFGSEKASVIQLEIRRLEEMGEDLDPRTS